MLEEAMDDVVSCVLGLMLGILCFVPVWLTRDEKSEWRKLARLLLLPGIPLSLGCGLYLLSLNFANGVPKPAAAVGTPSKVVARLEASTPSEPEPTPTSDPSDIAYQNKMVKMGILTPEQAADVLDLHRAVAQHHDDSVKLGNIAAPIPKSAPRLRHTASSTGSFGGTLDMGVSEAPKAAVRFRKIIIDSQYWARIRDGKIIAETWTSNMPRWTYGQANEIRDTIVGSRRIKSHSLEGSFPVFIYEDGTKVKYTPDTAGTIVQRFSEAGRQRYLDMDVTRGEYVNLEIPAAQEFFDPAKVKHYTVAPAT
jgi:hypothetical protein